MVENNKIKEEKKERRMKKRINEIEESTLRKSLTSELGNHQPR